MRLNPSNDIGNLIYKFTKHLMLYFNKNKLSCETKFFDGNWLPNILQYTSKTSNYFEVHSFPFTFKVASLLFLDKLSFIFISGACSFSYIDS